MAARVIAIYYIMYTTLNVIILIRSSTYSCHSGIPCSFTSGEYVTHLVFIFGADTQHITVLFKSSPTAVSVIVIFMFKITFWLVLVQLSATPWGTLEWFCAGIIRLMENISVPLPTKVTAISTGSVQHKKRLKIETIIDALQFCCSCMHNTYAAMLIIIKGVQSYTTADIRSMSVCTSLITASIVSMTFINICKSIVYSLYWFTYMSRYMERGYYHVHIIEWWFVH